MCLQDDQLRAEVAATLAERELKDFARTVKSLCENWGSGKQLTKTKAYQDACAILESSRKLITLHRT